MISSISARRRLAALYVACGALLWAGAAAAQTAFAPAAIVNDDVVTYYDVEQRAALLRLTGATGGGPEMAQAALDALIDDQLRLQAANRAGVEVSEEMVAAGLDEFAQRFGAASRDEILSRAAQSGVSPDALRDLIRSQVAWRDLVLRRFRSRATPSEIELDQEIELAASGRSRSYRLGEIAIPSGEGGDAQARAALDRVVRELRAGADFSTLARRFSRAPSAANGGDVGWVPETALPPEIGALIAETQTGEITPPIAVPGGFSIFRVIDAREEASPFAQSAQVSFRRIAISGDDEDAMEEARAISEQAEGCDAIPDLSDQATMESIDTKLVNALPGPIRGAVRLLQAGQASAPIRTDDGVEVFVVCDRSGGVDAETRNRLRDQITNQRISRLAEGFLQDLRREAVIERR